MANNFNLLRVCRLIVLAVLVALPVNGAVLAQGIDNPKLAVRQAHAAVTKPPGAYYVRYRAGQKSALAAWVKAGDVEITHEIDAINTVAVMVSEDGLDRIQKDPNVEFVEPVPEHHLAAQIVPWHIDMVQARDVWDVDRDGVVDTGAPDGSGVKLCIIDTGFYAAHDDFQGITVSGESQITGENWWEDGVGHGTHVAGIANAVNNDLGVVGVMPGGAALYIVKVFDNAGSWVSGESDLAAAAQACRDAGANAISMSLSGGYSATEEALFQDLYDNYGIVNIAAAGSYGTSTTYYPAAYDAVIAVAGVRDDEVVGRSSQFPPTAYDSDNPPANVEWDAVELSAGGEGILSTVPYVDGTIPYYQITPDGGTTYSGYHIAESGVTAPGGVSGTLVDGGTCGNAGSWAGDVVLCSASSGTFAGKINNVQDGGGIGAIIYNSLPGNFNGTCGGNCYATPIPAISLSQADGQALLASVGTNSTFVADDGSSCTTCTGGYDYMSGTSMATPAVAAGIAWMWDNCGGPTGITNKQLRQLLRDSAKDLSGTRQDAYGSDYTYGTGYDVHSGWGLIQLKDALDLGGERFGWQVCPPSGPFVIDPDPQLVSVCTASPADAVYTLDIGGKDFQGDIALSASGYPAGTTATFADSPVNVPSAGAWTTTSLTIGNMGAATDGHYTLNILGTDQADASNIFDVDVRLNVASVTPAAVSLTSPVDAGTDVSLTPVFTWTASGSADSYTIEIAADPNFATLVDTASALAGTSYTPSSPLDADTIYYWRVRADNPCGAGAWSAVYAFRTAIQTSCYDALSNGNFESGRDGSWTESAVSSGSALIGQFGAPRSGTWHAWLGYYNSETDDVYQNIVIPNGATASLSYWYRIYSAEFRCRYDYGYVRIDGSNVRSYGLCSQNSASQYAQETLDLNAYADGGSHSIGFRVTTDSSVRSDLYLDDVSLTICTAGTPVVADFSDLDSSYGVAWHTGNGTLRLGANWSAGAAFGKGNDDADDDGIIFFGPLQAGQVAVIRVNVSGTPSGANGWLRGWFDWDDNGVFDAGELVTDQAVTPGNHDLAVSVPATISGVVNYRFRLYDSASAPVAPMALDNLSFGGTTGGEVEDNASPVPTVVDLTRFEAVPDGGAIRVEWETATEIDNLGFNLYRSTAVDGPYAQLNVDLIPAQQPGQVLGAVYTWSDENVSSGGTFYYKLEDVDMRGQRTLHGPISAGTGSSPTATTLVSIEANGGGQSVAFVGLLAACGSVLALWLVAARCRQQVQRVCGVRVRRRRR